MSMTDNTTFSGIDAEGFYSQAFTSAAALENLTLLPNVKSSIKLASYDLGNILQATDGCSWANSGEGTLSQKSISVCDVTIQLEFCTSIWEQNYLSLKLRGGSNDSQIPPTFENYLLDIVGKQAAANLETIAFKGDTGLTSSGYPKNICNGLVKLALADSNVIDVTATASALSTSVVLTELNRILAATPAKVREKQDFVIFISQEMAFWYKLSQASTNYFNGAVTDAKTLSYIGYKMIATDALSGKEAMAFSKSNVFYATDIAGDVSDIQVINMMSTGVRNHRVTTNFKFGVNYLFGEEVVLYA